MTTEKPAIDMGRFLFFALRKDEPADARVPRCNSLGGYGAAEDGKTRFNGAYDLTRAADELLAAEHALNYRDLLKRYIAGAPFAPEEADAIRELEAEIEAEKNVGGDEGRGGD
jgi:hypothetical protein